MNDPVQNPALEHWMMAGWPQDLPTPSSWERVSNCPRSEALPHLLTEGTLAATMGTIVHDYLKNVRLHGRSEALEMAPESDRDWLDVFDLDKLPVTDDFWPEVAVAYNLKTGVARVLGHNYTRERARAEKTSDEVVGLMDVAADAGDDTVYVADFKSGFGPVTPAANNMQLKGYALMLARALGRSNAAINIIRVRTDGSPPWFDAARMSAGDLDEFEYQKMLPMFAERDRVRQATRERRWTDLPPHRESESWCKYCPAQNACAPRIGAMVLAMGDKGEELNLTPEKAGRYWPMVKVVRKTADRWEGLLETFAATTPFPLADGETWVGPVKRKPTETLLADRARDVLAKLFGELGAAVFTEAVEISDELTKVKLKAALRKLILPTRPGAKITHLFEGEVMPALRAGGATTAKAQKKVIIDEYRPTVEALEAGATSETEEAA